MLESLKQKTTDGSVLKKTGCVLIHGFTGTPWAMEHLGRRLEALGASVRIPLLPGHGTVPEDLNRVTWTDWIETVRVQCRSLEKSCDELFLIGLSMGGTISLLLAQERELRGVVCLSTPVKMKSWLRPLLPLIRLFIKEWKKKRDPAVSGHGEEIGYDRYTLPSLIEFFDLMKTCREGLHRVRCPVLIMQARNDRTVPERNADLIRDRIGSADKTVHRLNHPAHMITRGQNQDEVEQRVLAFVQARSTHLNG